MSVFGELHCLRRYFKGEAKTIFSCGKFQAGMVLGRARQGGMRMEDNNLQQEQQNQQADGQQSAAEQAPQNLQATIYTPQAASGQTQPADMHVQQPTTEQIPQGPQTYAYGQPPTQGQQAYIYAQQPAQGQQAYTYAQQPTQNQSPYLYGAPVQPMPAGGRKKKKTGVVIAGVLVAVIAIAIGIGFLVHASVSNSPEAKLAKGFENLAKEMTAGERAILDDIDYPAIIKTLQTDGGNVDLSLNFTMPGEDTIGFDYIQNYDRANKLMSADMIVSAYNISLVQMNLAADEDRLYFGMPGLVSDTYYINAATLGQEFNDSVWREMLGIGGIERDYALDLFPEITEEASDGWIFGEDLEKLAESITIESGASKEFKIDGKTVRCSGIDVKISREVINDLLDEAAREIASSGQWDIDFSARLESDVNLTVYLDNKDRIVCIETDGEIELKDSEIESVEFSFVFSGKERTVDEISGMIELAARNDTGYIELEGTTALTAAEYNSEFTITLGDDGGIAAEMVFDVTWDIKNREFEAVYKVYDEIEEIVFEMKGGFEDIEKGKSATFRLGQLRVLEDGEELCRFSGTLAIGPLTDKIEMPSEAVNFLQMSQEDIFRVISEVYENIMNNSWDDPWGVSPL